MAGIGAGGAPSARASRSAAGAGSAGRRRRRRRGAVRGADLGQRSGALDAAAVLVDEIAFATHERELGIG